jgi:DNA-directed RNA polymerase subunit RPC12/RpoP
MPKLITARCQACGTEMDVEWTRGTPCPRCGSDRFYPVVRVDEIATPREKSRLSRRPLGAVLVVVFFVGSVSALVYRIASTTRQKTFYRSTTMICTNPDCGKIFQEQFVTREVFPKLRCPDCKLKTAFRAVQCRNCGEIFGLDPDRKPNPITDLRCPHCGSLEINLDSSGLDLSEEEDIE